MCKILFHWYNLPTEKIYKQMYLLMQQLSRKNLSSPKGLMLSLRRQVHLVLLHLLWPKLFQKLELEEKWLNLFDWSGTQSQFQSFELRSVPTPNNSPQPRMQKVVILFSYVMF